MNKKLLLIFFGAFIFRLILSFVIWHPDVNSNADWGIRFFQYGASKFYAPETNVWSYTWPNQPPGTIYLFAGIRKFFEFTFNLFSIAHFKLHIFPGRWLLFFESNLYFALLKLPSLLADLGIGVLIYKVILGMKLKNPTEKAFWGTLIWLVNPIIWYNSAIWGQTDAIISFFALLSFYLLFRRKIVLSVLFLVLSFYIKVSLTIFLPIFVVVALRQKYKVFKLVKAALLSLVVVGMVSLPFSSGEPFSWLINLYQTKVLGQQLQIITANAFNIWATIASINERPQTVLLGPLTYQWWGIVLFSISYLPLLFWVWKKQDIKSVVIALALAAFSSWMLLTNMHERYLYPLFPYLTVLSAAGFVNLDVYFVVSLISLLNLYNFWWYPKVNIIVNFLSFGERIMPRILGLVNFGIFTYLYYSLLAKQLAKEYNNS